MDIQQSSAVTPDLSKASSRVRIPTRDLALQVTAIYAGSFDPFTLGHLDIVARAAQKFSDVVVAIGDNSSKTPMFSLEEKKVLIEGEIATLPKHLQERIRVESFKGLLSHYALTQGAAVLVRGVRGITDIPMESQQASINREQTGFGDVDTVFFPSRKELEDVSSSATKELLRLGGDVRNYVSRAVEEAMREKLRAQQGETDLSRGDEATQLDPGRAERIVFSRWMALCGRLRVSEYTARELGQEVLRAYQEPHRKYHNIVHIAEGLVEIEKFRDQVAALDAFELAWFTHDLSYNPGATTKGQNERDSIAGLTQLATRARIAPGVLVRASQFVEATIEHRTYEGDLDGAFFIDTDLSVLGASRSRFDHYRADLRSEYGIYDDPTFRGGRLQFVESMLARPQLFRTDLFRERYEAPARANLQHERERLVWGGVVAVTGSIGSGKSTVMKELAARGVACGSADEFARELFKQDTPTYDGIVAHFGPGILNPDRTINRSTLGKIVFSDPEEKRVLESKLHPEIQKLAFAFFRGKILNKEAKLAYEVPLLFETGLEGRGFKTIVVVTADDDIRLARILRRDGLSERAARARMASQLPQSEKVKKADIVIDNSGGPEALTSQLGSISL
jgi:dephospho-CoA kinase